MFTYLFGFHSGDFSSSCIPPFHAADLCEYLCVIVVGSVLGPRAVWCAKKILVCILVGFIVCSGLI